jgi:hypothetical protein
MTTDNTFLLNVSPWLGVLDPSAMADEMVRAGHLLADAAKAGNWRKVFTVLDREGSWLTVNQCRPGGPAWFTTLHQAAWHGAPTGVVEGLIERGALRSLRDAKGRTPYDVAVEHDHPADLLELLEPPRSPLTPKHIRALDARLAEVIDGRIGGRVFDGDLRTVLRYPPVETLHEFPGKRVVLPLPGKYMFHIALQRGGLEVKSWCGLVEGSGQTHLVTPEGSVLVDHGFI